MNQAHRTDATAKVREFMEPFGDGDVWDWYVIGGRYSNILIPTDKAKEYNEYANSILEPIEGSPGFITQKEVEKKRPLLQAKWKALGLIGNCAHSDNYKLSDDGDAYDAVPLNDCLDKVKEWVKDVPAEIEETWKKLVKEKAKGKGMIGYYAKELYNLDYGNFCFDSNVYDITELEAESIPEDTAEYFAVMVDIHN